jgi:hypothetical protein
LKLAYEEWYGGALKIQADAFVDQRYCDRIRGTSLMQPGIFDSLTRLLDIVLAKPKNIE